MKSFDDIQSTVAKHLIFPDARIEVGRDSLINPAIEVRLNRLAGFICAVRHVQYWSSIPKTFEFLKKESLYYSFFEFYEPQYQTNRLKKRAMPNEQLGSLVEALKRFIEKEPASEIYRKLSEVLTHEQTVLKLMENRSKDAAVDSSVKGQLRWNGDVVVKKISHWFADECLKLYTPESESNGERSVLYQRKFGSDSVNVMACDEDTAAIISLIDSVIKTGGMQVQGLEESDKDGELIFDTIASLSSMGLIIK